MEIKTMPKIYLSPARHKPDNPCSYDKKCGENKHNEQYIDELVIFLTACGFEYKRNKPIEAGGTMQTAVKESNEWGADLHYVSHTNAFNGEVEGCRPIVYPNSGARRWLEIILKYRKEIYPFPIKINERTDLYELNATRALAIYEEHVFHDNKNNCKWFHENMRDYARQTCKGFCDIFNIPFIDPYILKGDLDKDGKLTVADVVAIRKLIMDGDFLNIADIDGDGKNTVTDIVKLRQKIMVEPKQAEPKQSKPNRPVSKYGSSGEHVKYLQTVLSYLKLYYDKIDGNFGPLTLNAVRNFQKLKSLEIDGICGPKTWAEINKVEVK